jgi:NADPH-dependent F420 reductase
MTGMADLPDQRALPDPASAVVGVLGGTGPLGRGLARRLGLAGSEVVLGSRDAARAQQAAEEMRAAEPALRVRGADNAGAARDADVVLVAVPYDGHRALLAGLAGDLAGKVVVDCVNPLGFDSRGPHALTVEEGSAAEQAAAVLPDSRVIAAFHHVSAVLLLDPNVASVDTDVLVLGDDREAAGLLQALLERVPGMRGVWAGRLRNAGQVEALTANLIAINKRYKTHSGIRVTGV